MKVSPSNIKPENLADVLFLISLALIIIYFGTR